MHIKQFIARHGITMTADWADRNPNMDGDPEWARMASHWRCRLVKSRDRRRQLTVYFSQGPAHASNPKVDDVLDCLAMDAAAIENASSFEDWCSEYGYDTDSRRAERIYNVCRREAKRLKQFIGNDAAYRTLLFDTEKL